jgi:prepilin-type processing-associated H-X9-DG protein
MDTLRKDVSWPVAAAVIGGFVVVLWFGFSGLQPHAGPAHRAACMNNVRQIGLALRQYADDHKGQYPDSFAVLLKEGYITSSKVFVCPSSRTRIPEDFPTDFKSADLADLARIDEISDYVMVGNLDGNAPAQFILAHDRAPNHDGQGRNVGFMDGHVKWHTEEEFRRLISAQRDEMDRREAEKMSVIRSGKE